MTIPIAVDVRFHKWNDILAMPQPDPAMKVTTGFWHFARGMALAGTGKWSEAEAEYKAEYKIVFEVGAEYAARCDLRHAD